MRRHLGVGENGPSDLMGAARQAQRLLLLWTEFLGLANASHRAFGFQSHRVHKLNRPDGVSFIIRCKQKDTALPLVVHPLILFLQVVTLGRLHTRRLA